MENLFHCSYFLFLVSLSEDLIREPPVYFKGSSSNTALAQEHFFLCLPTTPLTPSPDAASSASLPPTVLQASNAPAPFCSIWPSFPLDAETHTEQVPLILGETPLKCPPREAVPTRPPSLPLLHAINW